MYNRYIPQQDGSYQKNRVPSPQPVQPAPIPCEEPKEPEKCHEPASGFLRQLIPRNLDTGDLIIILLLLLMAGDCDENRNNWLLTLALYLFM